MRALDYITWLAAPTEAAKYQAWQECHVGVPKHYYTNCPDIKKFWKCPIGRLYRDIIMASYHVGAIPRKIRWWLILRRI
jgi:hypothetical protein